jgi:hypothetical protein
VHQGAVESEELAIAAFFGASNDLKFLRRSVGKVVLVYIWDSHGGKLM